VNRRRATWVGVGTAAAAAGLGWGVWRETGAERPNEEFWSLQFEQPDGGQLALEALRGRPLLVNFWATWCPPCIKELPELDRFNQAQRSRGIQVIGLAVDSPTAVRAYLARQPLSFAVGLAGLEGTNLTRKLGNPSGALPFSVWLDAAGTIRERKLGQTSYDELVRWAAK